ncbi:hypothetical protein [Capnocytophaga sp. oral taxon 338]|uniref:hypothetical protein n=1 Tax=Capnocytophaga sp. oral taxon 338 TaxID=710239 RepID=UPI000202E956|nr:hypothetical protein [Capnocytophaga sp. oral taxon 338]EGD33109.1 hypothetical protein HMPREF9071_2302 [Capnocytophaga sp. oral taxon 338 str. F0234]
MKYFVIFLALLSTSCNLFQGQQSAEEKQQQEEVFVPVEKELYVISSTAMQYTEPDIHSEPKDRLDSFGYLFEIEAESEHFYKIKSNWDWYLRKEDMGSYEDIRFTKEALEDVYIIGKKREDGTIENEEGTTLSKYFIINLISYEEYQKALSNGYFPLERDTVSIKKEKWILTLPCRDTLVELKDSELNPEADREEYEYLGEMKPIHQYLIAGTYDEAWDKFFIDKRTGHKTEIDSHPYLSPNGKYIITLGVTEMGGPTAIALYKVLNKEPFEIELVAVVGVRYWIAYENDKKRPTFFGKDGCLYVAMDAYDSYQYDKPDKPCKYIRIKIKQ